jgi:hypothetical protein
MRRLIDHLKTARTRHRTHNERGAIAVTTALALVVLLGFAAIAIDVGMMYEERAQLQNGADSAALAIAQNCIESPAMCSASASQLASDIAQHNTRDNLSEIASLTFPTSASVRVQTQAKDGQADAGKLALSIAPLLGVDDPSISAAASASWGGPGTGPAMLPIAVSHCQATKAFEQSGSTVVLDITGKSSLPGCAHEGHPVPGGFGWFRQGSKAECGQETSYDDIVFSDPGNDFAASCDEVLKNLLNKSIGDTLLLPVYDSTSDSGNNAKYYISGWIAFKVTGWNFGGSAKDDNNVNVREHANQGLCTGSCRGIIGSFVRYASLDELYTDDGPLTYGAAVVKLSD